MNSRAGMALVLLMLAAPAPRAADLDNELLRDMQREIEALRERVAELESRLADRDRPASHAAAAPRPARTVAVERARSLEFGGRAKVDAIVNSVSSGSNDRNDALLSPGSIPLDSQGEDVQLTLSARGSRIWFKAVEPTASGPAAAYFEMDFFGSNDGTERITNGYSPRLRHGYGEWRGWLAGQTYTTFMNASAYPELNDDGIPAGGVLVRQPMLRWTYRGSAGELAFAAESPETTLTGHDGVRLSPDDDRMPDWIARYTRRGSFGNWSLAAMVRELRIDDDITGGGEDAAHGYAFNLAGRVNAGPIDDVRFSISGGDALGRYANFNAFNGGRLDGSGNIAANDSVSGYFAWRHWWSTRWRSNFIVGAAWQDDAYAQATENESLLSLHANLLWSPLPSTTAGIEFIYARRERFDGRRGELGRLNLSAIHKF